MTPVEIGPMIDFGICISFLIDEREQPLRKCILLLREQRIKRFFLSDRFLRRILFFCHYHVFYPRLRTASVHSFICLHCFMFLKISRDSRLTLTRKRRQVPLPNTR